MSFIVSSLTDYTQAATEIFRENVLFSDDYAKYNIQEGIPYKEYINYLTNDIVVQAGGCGLTASGNTGVNQKVLTVGYYGIKSQYCYDDLRKKAIRAENFENELTLGVVESIKYKLNQDFWNGAIADGDLIDGLCEQVSGDTNVVEVTTSTTGSTVSTIITHINSLISGMPDNLWTQAGEITIHTSVGTYNMYRQGLTLGNYYHLSDNELGKMEMWVFGYEGKIKIKGEPGFTADATVRMLLAADNNIYIGVDELQTVSELKIVDDPITDYIYYKSKFKFGVTYLFSDEVVILSDY